MSTPTARPKVVPASQSRLESAKRQLESAKRQPASQSRLELAKRQPGRSIYCRRRPLKTARCMPAKQSRALPVPRTHPYLATELPLAWCTTFSNPFPRRCVLVDLVGMRGRSGAVASRFDAIAEIGKSVQARWLLDAIDEKRRHVRGTVGSCVCVNQCCTRRSITIGIPISAAINSNHAPMQRLAPVLGAALPKTRGVSQG
jgi:hypothetical protein